MGESEECVDSRARGLSMSFNSALQSVCGCTDAKCMQITSTRALA